MSLFREETVSITGGCSNAFAVPLLKAIRQQARNQAMGNGLDEQLGFENARRMRVTLSSIRKKRYQEDDFMDCRPMDGRRRGREGKIRATLAH